MIRTDSNAFTPGSLAPSRKVKSDVSRLTQVQHYIGIRAWETGVGPVLVAPAGSGKTPAGISIMREIRRSHRLDFVYWTEHDFLADLRYLWRVEEMTQKHARDDSLWAEYLDWERAFWNLKECQFLFLDDVGRAYTPMQRYEVENLLRLRETKGLPTMVACQTGLWENLPSGLKSVISRNGLMLNVEML